ncbi:unnamed protein product [Spirodela intermedia]|uniref:HMA domain-containing protein n=1 Tax=Spirodela intermedia TaxID=51605 RepID=A0A7I8K1L4_SPIIN|nr:unnamed protein product [Spirodela intermedia]
MGEMTGGNGTEGEKNKAKGGAKKKVDAAPVTVVFKVDLHCEGCAMKLKRSVKVFEGVEAVSADYSNSKLTVVGKVDPLELRERVESKIRKKVVLVSPNVPKKNTPPKDKKADDSKPKAPASSTVVLKIRLHCGGCIRRIRKSITKIKGVETVSFDPNEDLVTVKGTMDGETLPDLLRKKLRRSVEVAPSKKGNSAGGNKKKKGGNQADGDGKEDSVGGEKISERKDGGGAKADPIEYLGGKQPYGYRFELAQPPLFFSDENPNACSIM